MLKKNRKILRKIKSNLSKQGKLFYFLNFILLILLTTSLMVNQSLINKTKTNLGISSANAFSGLNIASYLGFDTNNIKLNGSLGDDVVKLVISKGAPDIYGSELGITFDQVQQSINILRQFDPDYGNKKIILSGNDFKRYKDVAIRISCEYCCGAKSIISTDGKAACGCAHSQAMRGLLAHLLKNHGTKYDDDELLRELARWKGMYFPKQMIKKLSEQIQSGNYTPDTASLVLGVKLPKYSGNNSEAPLPSSIKNLPSMVGGC